MASTSAKRTAPFKDDESAPKRPRRDEYKPREERSGGRNKDGNQTQTNPRRSRTRSRSPGREKPERQRSRERYRDRGGPPNGASRRSPPRGSRRDRSRERSPRRERARDRSHERPRAERDKERADRAPNTRHGPGAGARPAASSSQTKVPTSNGNEGKMDLDPARTSDEELEARLMEVMGFGSFKTTKNTKVPGNDKLYGVRKEKTIEYRQYMNRVGGFNRPLSPSR